MEAKLDTVCPMDGCNRVTTCVRGLLIYSDSEAFLPSMWIQGGISVGIS